MNQDWLLRGRSPLLLGLICLSLGAVVFLWRLGSVGLIDETEPLFAEAARQMVVTGDWVTPYFNGEPRFDKPPLIYWLMAIAYQNLGVNEWAARFPSALAAIALMVLLFWVLWRFSPLDSGRCAFWGTVLLALNCETLAWGRTAVSDMLLSVCLSGALLCFFVGYAQSSQLAYLAFYGLAGAAVLTKGPIGIVIPLLTILPFLLYTGNWRVIWREVRSPWGIGLFLLIVLPWYLLVIQANGESYLQIFFGRHNLERFTEVIDDQAGPWYYYFPVVFLGFAPWSIFLPAAIARLRLGQHHFWRYQRRSEHLGIYAFFWFVSIFLFFSVAVTKRPSYVLPLIPAAAILVSLYWNDIVQARFPDRSLKLSGWMNVLWFWVLSLAFLGGQAVPIKDPGMPQFGQALHQSGLLVGGGVLWGVTGAIASYWAWHQRWQRLWMLNLIGFMACFFLIFIPAYQLVDSQRQLPLRQIAQTITTMHQADEPILMVGFWRPSLVFYTHQPIKFRRNPKKLRSDLEAIAQQPPFPESALVIGYQKRFETLKLQPSEYEMIKQVGAYNLVRVFINASD